MEIWNQLEERARRLAPGHDWLDFLVARRLLQAPEPDPARAEQLLTPLLDHPPDDSFRCFLMVALVIGELPRLAVRTEPILRQAIALDDLYLFAGLRPDATPAAAAARRVAALLALPAEQVARFCDRPKPPDWLERYRPFAEGRSRGASDPADRAQFCREDQQGG